MRDFHLRFGIESSTCQRSHLSLVFCECLQVIMHKGDTSLAYEISPMYRGSQLHNGDSPTTICRVEKNRDTTGYSRVKRKSNVPSGFATPCATPRALLNRPVPP